MDINKESIKIHKKLQGKVEVTPKENTNKDNISLLYTPGVAEISRIIGKDVKKAYDYTIKSNTIAIVSDGSAILGLGNLGPEAALPVMEGKAVFFKQYGDVNAVPLCIKDQDAAGIINFVENIAPTFGGINIEDIASPICFTVVDTLTKNLDIPIFHDDQHGSAIVTLSALINALKVTNKDIKDSKIVLLGAGAAGYGVVKILDHVGAKNVIVLDSKGIINKNRENLDEHKKNIAQITNLNSEEGDLEDAIKDADVFIGFSGQKSILTKDLVKTMKQDPIIFALSNPDPEIMPQDAKDAGAKIIATGRSDFPNQINNVVAFPFVMRKILDENIKKLDQELFHNAAKKIASVVKDPTTDHIIPSLDEMENVKL
ncbi:NAD-dependent malic enzyme [archaeon]|nr:NAD-dependent malic enzyme [archaeon]|tara:strand:- start:26242 stop:27357 length:1116 start_codon:yes stop_codon:yes gene_type:complete